MKLFFMDNIQVAWWEPSRVQELLHFSSYCQFILFIPAWFSEVNDENDGFSLHYRRGWNHSWNLCALFVSILFSHYSTYFFGVMILSLLCFFISVLLTFDCSLRFFGSYTTPKSAHIWFSHMIYSTHYSKPYLRLGLLRLLTCCIAADNNNIVASHFTYIHSLLLSYEIFNSCFVQCFNIFSVCVDRWEIINIV